MPISRDIDFRQGFKPKKIRLEVTKEKLVASSGLGTIVDLFDSSPLAKEFAKCLPERNSNRSQGSYRLGLILLASLVSDHDCLDDLVKFEDDSSLEEYFEGEIPVPKTIGNFLRDFDEDHLEKLSLFLTKMGYGIRKHVKKSLEGRFKVEDKSHFSIDSTFHIQHGDKIEGCDFNYKGEWGVQSHVVFDELGLNYGGDLQSGTVKPGTGGEKLIEQTLAPLRAKKLKSPFEKVAHMSADSAYIFQDFIKTCQANHTTFTISAPKTIKWNDNIGEEGWVTWEYSAEEIKKYEKKNKKPPEIYLKKWMWQPGWSKTKLLFPVIIKKEWKPDKFFEDCGNWHYHAVVTNMDLSKNSYQSVIESYRKRANIENHIKEYKINFDAKHLPCLKFKANHAYMLFVLTAHNLLRWVALIDSPTKPLYAKKLRRKFIFHPGKLVSHARRLTLKVSKKFKEEVDRLEEAWGLEPEKVPLQLSSA